jgi:hypothetical protein
MEGRLRAGLRSREDGSSPPPPQCWSILTRGGKLPHRSTHRERTLWDTRYSSATTTPGGWWTPIRAGVQTLNPYAIVELELAAVEWAIRKCRLYLSGLPNFTLMVDHQALVAIMDKYTLDAIDNPKIQRLKERLSPN